MKKIILAILLLIYLGVIFYLSHQDATISSNSSNKVIEVFIDNNNEIITFLVRKSAHFLLYLGLGILVYFNLYIHKLNTKEIIVYGIIFCVLYAISDEFHQTFINGRSGEIKDVLIDSIGATTGILGITFLKLRWFKSENI